MVSTLIKVIAVLAGESRLCAGLTGNAILFGGEFRLPLLGGLIGFIHFNPIQLVGAICNCGSDDHIANRETLHIKSGGEAGVYL